MAPIQRKEKYGVLFGVLYRCHAANQLRDGTTLNYYQQQHSRGGGWCVEDGLLMCVP